MKIFEIADVWVAAEDKNQAMLFYLDEILGEDAPEEGIELKELSDKNLRTYEYYDENDNCDEQKTFWDRLQEDIAANKQVPYLFAQEL